MALELGINLGYSGRTIDINYDEIRNAEAAGYDSIWTAESWGSDAVSPLAFIGANTSKIRLGTSIMQMPGRSPANTAMTALTMQQLSGGRFVLGVGTSGPQVVEGWHGKPWHKPLTMTREYIKIVKQILAREEKLEFEGEFFSIPYKGENSKGLGKPLKSMIHPSEPIPIHIGSMSPKGQELAGELCDGLHLTSMIPERPEVIMDNVKRGFEKRTDGKKWEDFEVLVTVPLVMLDDAGETTESLQAKMFESKAMIALYVGGMGAKGKNFYKEYYERAGFEEVANKIQDLYLGGKQQEAIAAVSDDMVRILHMVGTRDELVERYKVWEASSLTTMLFGSTQAESVKLAAELKG